jgi:hypothetical protein
MDIDLGQLPIPDWGLECPTCRYPLRGLPQHRCPECGLEFEMADVVRPWTRLRAPRFTGRELPVPDYGLACRACGSPLAGAPQPACSTCGRPFDLEGQRPAGEWFILGTDLCAGLAIPGVQSLLAAEHVPYAPVNEMTLAEIWGGQSILPTRLRVPSEFYFDVLWLLRRARQELLALRAAGPRAEWRCANCGEANPGHFDICWNCAHVR